MWHDSMSNYLKHVSHTYQTRSIWCTIHTRWAWFAVFCHSDLYWFDSAHIVIVLGIVEQPKFSVLDLVRPCAWSWGRCAVLFSMTKWYKTGIFQDCLRGVFRQMVEQMPVLSGFGRGTDAQSLLTDPNPNSPANSEAARMYSENRYVRVIRVLTDLSRWLLWWQ